MRVKGFGRGEGHTVNEMICSRIRSNVGKLIRLTRDGELATDMEEMRGERTAEGWDGDAVDQNTRRDEISHMEYEMEHMRMMEAESQEEEMDWMEEEAETWDEEMEEP